MTTSDKLVLPAADMSLAFYERSVVIARPVEDVFAFCASRKGFEAHFPHAVRRYEGDETWRAGTVFTFDYEFLTFWLPWQGEITAFEPNVMFRDVMKKGTFKAFEHTHLFARLGPNETRYTDSLRFTMGFAGLLDEILGKRLVDATFAKRHDLLKRALEG